MHWSIVRSELMKVITVFPMRMSFVTLSSVFLRKTYWRNFVLVSVSGRMGLLQATGFISLMNTMNHARLLSWAAEMLCVKRVALPYKGGQTPVMCWFYSWLSQPSIISFLHLLCCTDQVLVIHFSKSFWTKKGKDKPFLLYVFCPLLIQLLPQTPWKSCLTLPSPLCSQFIPLQIHPLITPLPLS